MKHRELHAIEMRIVQLREEERLPKFDRTAPYLHHTVSRATQRRGNKVLRALLHLGTVTGPQVAEYTGHGIPYVMKKLVQARRLGWALEITGLTAEGLPVFRYALTDAGIKEIGADNE